jgi:membrane protein
VSAPTPWRLAVRRAWHGFVRHNGIDSAAALTFFALLAAFPLTLGVVSVFAIFDDRDRAVSDLVAVLDIVLPDQAANDLEGVLRELLSLNNPYLALGFSLAIGLWTLSGYATAFGRQVNKVYEIEEGRPIWAFRGRMLGVAVLVGATGALAVTLLLGPREPLAWDIVRWVLVVACVFLAIALLYAFTPNVRRPHRRWVSVGSLVAILAWAIATGGVVLYAVLVDHGQVYGSLGGVIVALLWTYATQAALIAGAELDAEFTRLKQIADGADAAERVRLPKRDARRIRTITHQRMADVADSRALQDETAAEKTISD